jgi:hypothetical protein
MMSWERILLENVPSTDALSRQVDRLLENQRVTWPAFRDGEQALAELKIKILSRDNARIIVQANPGRHTSIHAKVDPVSVSERPCFLCVENIPREERGIGWGELIVLPNPHPILTRHLTIPTREHHPQMLKGRIETLLELSRDMGPEMLVLYNGARCGASAPDHFHFQAASSVGVPLFEEVGKKDGVEPHSSFGRRVLVMQGRDASKVRDAIQRTLEVLTSFGKEDNEPLVNMIAVHPGDRYKAFIFPRAKHRPACYFAEGNDRITVSPAALEMAGILVVADADHFDRIDEMTAQSIFEEVSLEEEHFQTLLEKVA